MKEVAQVVLYISVVVAVWGIGTLFADSVSDVEVIIPDKNESVKCVIVSRMFNTSVDCWKVKKEK